MDRGADQTEQLDRRRTDSEQRVDPIVGTTVGNYEVLEEIGRGGMGVVYRARQRGLEREVALKALHGATGLARGAGEALVKESRLAGSLNHANIVTVHEYLEEDGTPYIAMEYVPRGSLRPWIGCMSVAQLAGALEDLLAGLAAVAPSSIVHRDLKPENVMVTADGHVKIADFGIAKATQRVGGLGVTSTPTGMTVGTPAYMAPEQALCQDVGPWTDLYSVGIMAYEHLVGHLPFRNADTPMAMLLCHVRDPVPAPAELDDRIDGALSAWVSRLLVKDPERRTRSAAAAWEQLEEIVIDQLGAKWRRECRLSQRPRARIAPRRRNQLQFLSQKVTVENPSSTGPMFLTSPISIEQTAEQSTAAIDDRTVQIRAPRNRTTAASLAAAAAVALLGGFGIERAAHAGSGAPADRVSVGAVSASLSPRWSATATATQTPGYSFSAPIVARSIGPAARRATITLGITSSASAALLPADLLASGQPMPRREAVVLEGRSFFRYLASRTSDSAGPIAVYTQPTSAGVLVGICRLPEVASPVAKAGCEQLLGTTAIDDARPLELSQSAVYVASLSRVIGSFDHQRSALVSSLTRARSATAQSRASSRLAQLDLRTAESMRSLHPGPTEAGYNAAVLRSLHAMAAGHQTMAKAASREQSVRFKQGSATARSALIALRKTLADLATSG
jgi:serine/threonine protein kinase